MIPSTSGGTSASGCNPVSSTCVVWQGPDIPCINLCTGDTISEVIAKLAELVCQLQPPPGADCCDVSLLDPQCLDDFYKAQYGQDIPDDWVLSDYINLLIEYVCAIDGATDLSLPMMPVPNCIPRVYLNGDLIDNEDGMELVLPEGSIYMIDTTGIAGTYFNGNYEGWADMVVSVMCNMLACCTSGMPNTVPGPGEDRSSLEKIVDQRFAKLSSSVKYLPPKVVPRFVTNQVGKPVQMEVLLTALEKEFGSLRSMTGTPLQIRDAVKKQCMNLNNTDRLIGKGTFGTLPGWFMTPANLAQSHSNQWALLCEVTDAIKDIQKNHLGNVSCKDIIYDAKCNIIGESGSAAGITIDFTGTSVKAPFTDCEAIGAKITVVDSSLTTIVKNVAVSAYQNTQGGYKIFFTDTRMDKTSNYQVTIDFCFSDGTSTCAKTITYTIENSIACPTISFSNVTGSSFNYSATGLTVGQGLDVSIVCETATGTEVGRNVFSDSAVATVSGQFGGLMGGQSYHVYSEVKSKAGNVTSCDKNLVTTLVPSCSSLSVISAEYGSSISDISGNVKLELGCYNDGSYTWSTVVGFDSDGNIKIVKASDNPDASCVAGESITTYGRFASDDPSLGITCGNKTYVSGMPQSSVGSGWQYVNAITNSKAITYYIYALVNKDNNTIDQVVACCDCKAVYIKTHNTMSYCKTGSQTEIKIDVAGFVSGLEKPRWAISPPHYGTAVLNNVKSTANEAVFTYRHTGSSTWSTDSFTLSVQNDCGSSNELVVPVARGMEIPMRDTDITIFVDTCTISYTDAVSLKASFEEIKAAAKVICPNWTGSINYVPVDSTGNSGDYINHAKAMIDMKSGATGSVTVAGGSWTSWKSIPAHWGGTYKGSVPTSAYIISIIGSASTGCGSYGETNLAAGFGSQPKASYQQNYDELLDMVNGTTTTSWGGLMNSTQPGWGYPVFGTSTDKTKYFTHVVMPIISDTGSVTAAAALQLAGALFGNQILASEYKGLKIGNVQYPVNTSMWIESGVATSPVPYNVTTPRGNSMTGLQDYGYVGALWLEKGTELGVSNLDLKSVLLSVLGLDSSLTGFNCSNITTTGTKMADSHGRNTYSFGASCANASNAARSSTNPMCIYNNTGTIFDTSSGNELAYKTAQGCSEAIAADQIDPGWYCVINGANNYGVAQYTTNTGWSNVQCADGLGGCKAC